MNEEQTNETDSTLAAPIIMEGVRTADHNSEAELVRNPDTGRLCVRIENESGNNDTWLDLCDLLEWLKAGPVAGREAEQDELARCVDRGLIVFREMKALIGGK